MSPADQKGKLAIENCTLKTIFWIVIIISQLLK